MTKVSFYTDNNQNIYGFCVDGHSGFANRGKDVVCAAISVLSINTVNSFEELLHKHVVLLQDEKKGYLEMKVSDYTDSKSQLLFQSLLLGLTEIAKQYPKYLKLDK